MVRGMGTGVVEATGLAGLQWWGGVGWRWVSRGSGYFESGLQHSPTQQISRTQPVKPVDDDCPYTEPRSLYGCHCEDIVCLTIRYHENDGSDAVTDSKTSLKTLHQDTDIWLHLLREIRYRSNSVRHGELSSP